MRVVFDTCIIVDVLQKREPFCVDAMKLVNNVSDQKIEGLITAKSITDIYYLTRKNLHSESETRKIIDKLFILFNIEDTYASDCHEAVSSTVKDYEDAIMVQTAKRIGADYIVSRNGKDYIYSEIPVVSPQELIKLINGMDQ